MKKNKAYKFRIYPDEEQKSFINQTIGCTRFIYNKMLEKKIEYYKENGKMLTNTPAQYKSEYPFLKNADSLALANAQQNLQAAFKNFFSNPKTGFPKYKSKHKSRKSYTTNNQKGTISLERGKLKLPKAGYIKVKQHREVSEEWKIKSATISISGSGKYYASVLFEYDEPIQEVKPEKIIGLDYSMHELYRDSEGKEPMYPRYYRISEARLKKEQRKLSRMEKGSSNRNKQRIKVAKLHEKVANQRKDFLHKQSRQIANDYDCVCIENLDMKGMSQALNFGKSISDNGWGMFTAFLKYKLEEAGKKLIKVDRFFASSQICSCCGHRNSETKNLAIRAWDCPKCGAHHDRDTNAAINIRNEGLRIALA